MIEPGRRWRVYYPDDTLHGTYPTREQAEDHMEDGDYCLPDGVWARLGEFVDGTTDAGPVHPADDPPQAPDRSGVGHDTGTADAIPSGAVSDDLDGPLDPDRRALWAIWDALHLWDDEPVPGADFVDYVSGVMMGWKGDTQRR